MPATIMVGTGITVVTGVTKEPNGTTEMTGSVAAMDIDRAVMTQGLTGARATLAIIAGCAIFAKRSGEVGAEITAGTTVGESIGVTSGTDQVQARHPRMPGRCYT